MSDGAWNLLHAIIIIGALVLFIGAIICIVLAFVALERFIF